MPDVAGALDRRRTTLVDFGILAVIPTCANDIRLAVRSASATGYESYSSTLRAPCVLPGGTFILVAIDAVRLVPVDPGACSRLEH